MTCYGEGDILSENGAAGDVVFDVEPVMPSDRYRFDPVQMVLERMVELTPDEICYGTRITPTATTTGEDSGEKVVDVCGEHVPICVLPGLHTRWAQRRGHVMVVVGRGLMEDGGGTGICGGGAASDNRRDDNKDRGHHPLTITRGALHIVFEVASATA